MNTHNFINPSSMAPASGFAHIVAPASGRTLYLAGQVASDHTGGIVGESFAQQYDQALANIVTALDAAGARPEHLVSLVVYTTAMQEYRDNLKSVGRAHVARLGRHFPAMAMLGVTELFDAGAKVEIIATAVVPDDS